MAFCEGRILQKSVPLITALLALVPLDIWITPLARLHANAVLFAVQNNRLDEPRALRLAFEFLIQDS